MKTLLWAAVFLCSFSTAARAFESGSTELDGPLNVPANTSLVITLPTDGVLNYTTINIEAGANVTFQKNAANTPVYMRATGDVSILGTINVSGTMGSSATDYGRGGPGGFDGGFAGTAGMGGGRGMGPGGGSGTAANSGDGGGGGGFGSDGGSYYSAIGGPSYGNARVLPVIGGSGGGGAGYETAGSWDGYGNGGGGGGAIVIASSTSITVGGSIIANGGNGYTTGTYYYLAGGGGSGGAIKLVANSIYGNGTITALGGTSNRSGAGGAGRIRLEASSNGRTSSTNPGYSFGAPSSVFVPQMPTLTITSIAGVPAPGTPTGNYSQPDVTLPSTTANPVAVNVSATNIPPDTAVALCSIPQYGSVSCASPSPTLTGDQSASSASGNVTLSTTYSNVITAQATFQVIAMYYDGEEIDRVRVATKAGGKTETTYLTKSGKEIKGELMALLKK